ncbi:hypothetical protein MCBMB27_03483 [Methylobacterium phyllosphaerae]|uniref:Anti-sigma factor NepR domain-containing protein n=1 Tax=Methylobacterium phyllosphaerae TaxID=418223 RepID=A0AAE8L9W5_9HYPH|nr:MULTISPECIES: NepR family anti-sigma factor [Methylobacterium]APT32774.1 hypothetical protein MCBMB27_03483 [Methylobacterium phyllosphaerae]MDE4911437.1 NepR family anti-sigma factor [Methylobacterium sp. 092160098-2]SFH77164.1 hypothetical protein SAMN05192567_1608 [Methylobacterium phyllosphaerae]
MSGNEDDRARAGSAGAPDATEGCAAVGPRPARRAGAPGRSIDGAARDRIGRGLRLHYAGVLALPIPDRLRMLLDDLAACSDTEASQ